MPSLELISNRCYLIAEIGVNHNGDIELAKKLIYEAKNCGADAVKFQTFKAELLASELTPKVKYQINTTGIEESHFDMLKKLELSFDDHFILKEYCDELNIDFISTPYDVESASFLNKELSVKAFKTASADIVDLPLQSYIASTGKISIISVGMATLGEIESVYNLYEKSNKSNLIFLHCVSNYPCSDSSLNLNVISTLQKSFQVPIGYSDHSIGNTAAIISISLGARVIEKHLTLDKNLPGPDHLASITPKEFSSLSNSIRRAESILGTSVKKCQKEEIEMSKVSRKSLHLTKEILEGEIISEKDLTLKRPGTGLNYSTINYLIGKQAKHDLNKGHMICFDDLR